MNRSVFFSLFLLISLLVSNGIASAQSVLIVNRTGNILEVVQAAPSGQDQWGDDLIADRVLEDTRSVSVDLIGTAPWSFRFIDSNGDVYVLYEIEPSRTGKLSVGPEHLARSFMLAGSSRNIQITNKTGSTISNIRISAVSEERWGSDLLSGRFIRNEASANAEFQALAGTLTFDISFALISDGREISYEKPGVILTDGASIILSVPH